MKKRVRIGHTSDVHLDGRSKKTSSEDNHRNVAERAFAEVVRTVVDKSCDLFLIVGDLFDHNRIEASDVDFVSQQLDIVPCPTVLIPGNHDVHDEGSVWHKFDPEELGENVHCIMEHKGSVLEFPDLDLTLWGKAMEVHEPDNQPLAGIPTMNGSTWKVGLAHGQVADTRVTGSSSLITREEIGNSGFDYLALGHVHVWATYHFEGVHACYPGSPVAAYASSQGGHLAIVDLDPRDGVQIHKHRLETREEIKQPQNRIHFLVP